MDEVLEKKDIITLDSDIPEDGDGGLYPYDPSTEDIDFREDSLTVYELIRKYNQKKLIIDPDFQRNLVWNVKQRSQFIESILLNFPLPPWYVNQAIDGNYIIVDGLQRTSTLYDFFEDEFALQGLKVLEKLNNCKFSDLENIPGNYQTKIEDKQITLYRIMPTVPSAIVYDIFHRVNTGGTQLNQQEVRNCIFSGKSTILLKELAESDFFSQAIDNGVSGNRMKDREVILRYLAFKIFDYESDYIGNMSTFLEKAMKKINLMKNEDIEKLRQDFERVMKITYDFFGKNNFRLPINDQRGRISIALLESVAYFFSGQNDEFLEVHKEKIKDNFQRLLKDEMFLNAIKSATSGKNNVKTRFEQAKTILGDV
jgi:hypothetical protein